MALIRVKSIRDIPRDKIYKVEATNKLYMQGDDRVLKLFLDCYQRLDNKLGRDIYETLEILMSLDKEETSHLILPEDIYVSDKRLYGYATKYYKGTDLKYISRKVRLMDLLRAYEELVKDFYVLAARKLMPNDVHMGNLLFNELLYMLDFDLFTIDSGIDSDKLYMRIAYQVWQQILRTILWYDKYDLYITLNQLRISDFNLVALQYGIMDITSSIEAFKKSLFTSLEVTDDVTLEEVDKVLRRRKNGY